MKEIENSVVAGDVSGDWEQYDGWISSRDYDDPDEQYDLWRSDNDQEHRSKAGRAEVPRN